MAIISQLQLGSGHHSLLPALSLRTGRGPYREATVTAMLRVGLRLYGVSARLVVSLDRRPWPSL